MIIKRNSNKLTFGLWCSRLGTRSAFTLIEVVMGAGLAGMLAITLYSAIGQSFAVVNVSRENLRATQILEEKMEVVRLCTLDQINTTGFVPTPTTDYYDPSGSAGKKGAVYTVTATKGAAGIVESYANDMSLVVVTVTWTSNNIQHQRFMQTFVSRWGLQNYVYPLVKP